MKRLLFSATLMIVFAAASAATPAISRAQVAPSPSPAPAPAAAAVPQQVLGGSTSSSQPVNAQSINPVTNSAASGTNVNTQINTVPLGLYSFGIGIQCPTPQFTMGAFQQNLNQNAAAIGTSANGFGVSVGYQAPVGHAPSKTCQALGDEILKQKTLDTQLTMIAKCGEFAKAGLVLHPEINPALKPIADVCAAVTMKEQADVPIKTISDSNVTAPAPVATSAPAAAPAQGWKYAPKVAADAIPCAKYHEPNAYEKHLLGQLRAKKPLSAKLVRSLRCVNPLAMIKAFEYTPLTLSAALR